MASNIKIEQAPVTIEEENNAKHLGSSSSGARKAQTSNPKLPKVPLTNVLSFAPDNDEPDDELEPNPSDNNHETENDGGRIGDGPTRKHHHRHTTHQIQEMEEFFKRCPHPNERQRKEFGIELGLAPLQVKYWFQNKRTQIKAQTERTNRTQLKAKNERLRAENIRFREILANTSCTLCGRTAVVHSSVEVNDLRIENQRLREKLDRIKEIGVQLFSNAFATEYNALAHPDHNVSHHQVNFYNPHEDVDSSASGAEKQPYIQRDVISEAEEQIMPLGEANVLNKQIIIDLAESAMEELVQLAQAEYPLWIPSSFQRQYLLNDLVYDHMFPRTRGFTKPLAFRVEATRDTDVILMNQMQLIEVMMNMEKFLAVFCSMVSRSSLLEVISTGNEAGYDGALHLMTAEYQVLTPTIPTRKSTFARYCKKLDVDTWAVVDVSFEDICSTFMLNKCYKLPSGCIIQAIPNGCSRVIWIEHVKLDNGGVHPLGKPFVGSSLAFGAQRWLAILERQSERLATISMPNFPHNNDINTTVFANPQSRKSILKLGEKMVISFCGGMTSSNAYSWLNQTESGDEEVKIMAKTNQNDPGMPCGTVLSATTSFWIPVQQGVAFAFLCDETNRKEWDFLANTGDVQEFVHITNGHQAGNFVSMLQVTTGTNSDYGTVILQQCITDSISSSIIYAPIDPNSVKAILSGSGVLNNVKLLPSGITIYPSAKPPMPLRLMNDGTISGCLDAAILGSLMTVAFQILLNPSTGTTSISSFGYVSPINNLIERTVERIKRALLQKRS